MKESQSNKLNLSVFSEYLIIFINFVENRPVVFLVLFEKYFETIIIGVISQWYMECMIINIIL